jgi:malonyl-CoA O-methyltransferase
MDFAEGMAVQARKRSREYHVIQADASALPFRAASFDLILSNLAYQWVPDLIAAFAQNERCLKPGGIFLAAIFGRRSLQELFESLRQGGAKNLSLQQLPTAAEARKAILDSGLKIRAVRSQMVDADFHDMWQLMVWIKKIGANAVPRRGFLGKKILMKANEYYFRHYKTKTGVQVTFEVIWVEARKS